MVKLPEFELLLKEDSTLEVTLDSGHWTKTFYPKVLNFGLTIQKWTKTVTRHVIINFGENGLSKTTSQLRQNYHKSINKFIHKKSCPKGNSYKPAFIRGALGPTASYC